MDLRDRIREAIDRKPEMTIRNASLKAGLSDSALHKFLSHQTKSITIDNLEKLADALGVSLRWLLFGDPEVENVHFIWDHIPERRRHGLSQQTVRTERLKASVTGVCIFLHYSLDV